MATLNPVILKDKMHTDGSHSVRIAVRHKSKTSYIITKIKIDSLTQFRGGRIVRRQDAQLLNAKLQSLLDLYQSRLDGIGSQGLYTSTQLKLMIEKDPSICGNNFKGIAAFYVNNLYKEHRDRYAVSVNRTCRYFTEYVKGDILLKDITPNLIEGFSVFIRSKGMKEVSVGTMLAHLKAVINRAVKEQLVEYKIHPFRDTVISAGPVRRLDISLENFCKIRDSVIYIRNRVMARDLFLLSFYLGGMNLIDLMRTDFRTNTLEYRRSKTEGRISSDEKVMITIPTAARRIIRKWMNRRTGKLEFGYKFTYQNFNQYVTYSLKQLARESGIDERVTFYSARKSFAQYASELGIPDSIIDYCLGHSDRARGVLRYYTRVRQQQADIAISRVIDYTENPDKYKEFLEMRNDIMMMKL